MKLALIFGLVISTIVAGCYSVNSYNLKSIESDEKIKSGSDAIKISQPVPAPSPPPAPPPPPISAILPAAPNNIKIPLEKSIPKDSITNRTKETERAIKLPQKSNNSNLTSNILNHHDDFVDQLKTANMVMTVPESANINDSVRIELIINPIKEIETIKKDLTEIGKIYANSIQVSKLIMVTVSGSNFDIDNITPERQILSSTENTTWLWSLKPKSTGTHSIDVTVTAIVFVKNKEVERHIRTFKRTVNIEITKTQVLSTYIEKYWQWIFVTLLIPLIKFLYSKYKKKED